MRIGTGFLGVLCALLTFAFAGCAGVRATGELQQGRRHLLYGDPKLAREHFQRAAEMEPNLSYFSLLPQGLWTYLGRAHYAAGNLGEARRALERARAPHDSDFIARLYLGLVLAREGDRTRGLQEVEGGLRGAHDWLEFISHNTTYGQYWDPAREIRTEIRTDLAMISSRNVDWPALIASGERVGKKLEEEIDLSRRDETKDMKDSPNI